MKKIILCSILLIVTTNILCAEISAEKDKNFFKIFTKTKRNINTIKLKYLKKFFPLIGLTEKDAINIYKFAKKEPITSVEMLRKIPEISERKINILKKYFVFKGTKKKRKETIREEDIDEIIEPLIDELKDEESDIKETLEKYKDSPLDLNTATIVEIQEFPWITPILGLKIIKYRDKKGGFEKLSELKKVPGMTDEIYNKLKPFVTVKKEFIIVKGKTVKEKPKISGKIISRIIYDYPYSEEYLKENVYKRYIHNPVGIKEKIELNYGKIAKAGFMAERDAGEKDWNDMQKYYIQFNNFYFIKKIIWGNYKLYFGQGLVLYPTSSAMKKGEIIKIKQESKGIKPDMGSEENAYFYGPAIQLGIDCIDIFGFYSFKKYDATVEDQGTRLVSNDYNDDTPDDPSDNIITSFDTEDDGKHLTVNDKNKIDRLERKFIGGRIELSPSPKIKIGTSYFHSTYSIPINPEVKNNYYYKFRGDKLDALGFDFDFIYKSINIFGEIACSFFPKIVNPVYYDPYDPNNSDKKDNGMGIVIGKIIDVGKFKTAILYRKYDKDFYNYDNHGFQESDDQNEEGFYWAIRLNLDSQTKVRMYIDIYRMDWRKYYEIMPTRGYEVYTQIERKFLRKFKYTFRTKIENKDMKVSTDKGDELFWVQNDWRVRNEIEWAPSKIVKYRLRYEFSKTEYEDLNMLYNGYLIFVDIKYSPTKRLTFYLRDIMFDMPYEARIWEYENTIPSYMENLTFYGTGEGKGNRIYLLIKDQINKNLLWAFKIARTTYFKTTSIEQSELLGEEEEKEENIPETVLGNTQYDFRMEVQYMF